MEQKTKVSAENGKQYLTITREFDLPLELLFKAFAEPEIVEQWMGTKVLKLESKKYGSYQFETKNQQGNVVFKANGVIHDFVVNQKITRTFEMENAAFGVQLELLSFEAMTNNTSKLSIHTVFETVELRNQQLKLPFAYGLNMAHNKLQDLLQTFKK